MTHYPDTPTKDFTLHTTDAELQGDGFGKADVAVHDAAGHRATIRVDFERHRADLPIDLVAAEFVGGSAMDDDALTILCHLQNDVREAITASLGS